MVVPRALRVTGIIVAIVMLAVPAIACLHRSTYAPTGALELMHVLFPLWLVLLTQMCIEEGRARERGAHARREPGGAARGQGELEPRRDEPRG